jgi:hypothetical protein
VESKCLVVVRIEANPAQGGTQERGVHGDDGSKTALRTSNRDDVLMFGPGQTLQPFVSLCRGQATHDEILGVAPLRSVTEPKMVSRRTCNRLSVAIVGDVDFPQTRA